MTVQVGYMLGVWLAKLGIPDEDQLRQGWRVVLTRTLRLARLATESSDSTHGYFGCYISRIAAHVG